MPRSKKPAVLGTNADSERLDLKEACVAVARQIISEQGLEALSLREVARQLGVSHQAPYRHYENRDALVIEVLRRCYLEFARTLADRPPAASPQEDLKLLGDQFMKFAEGHKLEYRLLYGTSWAEQYKGNATLLKVSALAFEELKAVVRNLYQLNPSKLNRVEQDAMFIWMCIHGIVSLSQCDTVALLDLHTPLSPDLVNNARGLLRLAVRSVLTTPDSEINT